MAEEIRLSDFDDLDNDCGVSRQIDKGGDARY
jgi:hypothetical protein